MDKRENLHYKKVIDSYSIDYFRGYNRINDRFETYSVPKYGHWVHIDKKSVDEKEFKDNYANQQVAVESTKYTIVIEEFSNKISLKLYSTFRARSVGAKFFRVRKELLFVTYNLKFNNFYTGIVNKKNKKLINKRVRVNDFYNHPFSRIGLEIRKVLRDSSLKNGGNIDVIPNMTKINDLSDNIMNIFLNTIMEKCEVKCDIRSKDHEEKFFQLFLECNKFKYPNNYKEYSKLRIPKKLLKKQINLVSSFMSTNSLYGKKVRKFLNSGDNIDFNKLVNLYHLLGVDYFNLLNDSVFSKNDLQYYDSFKVNELDFSLNLSNTMKTRIVNVINQGLRFNLLTDHLRMVSDLREKHNYIFKCHFKNIDEFSNEHYDLSELLQSYNTGVINRNYGDEVNSCIENTISDLVGIEYYPKVLTSTKEYNEESQIQKNCVRTYSEKSNNIIISLRCGNINSNNRATIEYRFTKNNIERVQSLGGKNHQLSNMWKVPLDILDERVKTLYKNKILNTPHLFKEYKSGLVIERRAVLDGDYVVWDNSDDLQENEIIDLPF